MTGASDSAKKAFLEPYARKMLERFAGFIKTEVPQKAAQLTDLEGRLSYYAAKGDERGVDAVVGRFAAIAQEEKLELEDGAIDVLRMIGAALLDAAAYFVPRLVDQLADKIMPGGENGDAPAETDP